jgi:hypothetical protein
MSYADRIKSFFRFAFAASNKAASLPADVVFATSTPLTIAFLRACTSLKNLFSDNISHKLSTTINI